MNDTSVLLPLMPLARHLDVPEYMLRDLPPAGRAVSTDEPLYDPVAATVVVPASMGVAPLINLPAPAATPPKP